MKARDAQRAGSDVLRPLPVEQGVKFLCDRCKTRYSIGDERVRGKILKIRCKNCANVITVREGMTADAPGEPSRRNRPTTAAPLAQVAAEVAAHQANGAGKPPPAALEEEWYVSIDGEQEGPFTLADAQRWVASKPAEAELHCWSEGFDDWMPVDKVSHFRTARRKAPAQAPAPPPLPRATAPKPPAARFEDTPKPLFAATMAAIEKDADRSAPRGGNGAAKAAGKARNATVQGVGAMPLAGYDAESGDSMTAVEAPPFLAEAQTAAEPVASKRANAIGAPLASPPPPLASPPLASSPNGSASPALGGPVPPPAAPSVADALEDDDNLEIGEVSRVVNLADLMRAPQQRTQRVPASRASQPIPLARATGPVPKLSATDAGAAVPGMPVDPAAATAGESLMAPAPAVVEQRRGFVILLAFAAVLLLGAAGVVVWIVTQNNSDGTPVVLHHNDDFNTDQPDIVVTRPIIVAGSGASHESSHQSTHHWITSSPHPGTPDTQSADPNHRALDGDEIQDEASKQAEMTNRCYMRAQRGVDAIIVGDVKRIDATLTIDKTGTVTDVRLSSHANDTLGKCLIARLRSWKFRENPGGIFRITLAFANG